MLQKFGMRWLPGQEKFQARASSQENDVTAAETLTTPVDGENAGCIVVEGEQLEHSRRKSALGGKGSARPCSRPQSRQGRASSEHRQSSLRTDYVDSTDPNRRHDSSLEEVTSTTSDHTAAIYSSAVGWCTHPCTLSASNDVSRLGMSHGKTPEGNTHCSM